MEPSREGRWKGVEGQVGVGALCKHTEKDRGKSAKPSCYGLVCYDSVQ